LAVEGALLGTPLNDPAAWRSAAEKIGDDFTPLTDMRASAEYRDRVAKNLVVKALAEIAGASRGTTRILDSRETAHVTH
jgi:xanthine dehydrogenase small subunit